MNNITATQIREHLVNTECWNPTVAGKFLREVGTETRTQDEWMDAIFAFEN
jgi:hypothetical protein